MPKFTSAERILLKSIVATLSIKRIPDAEIIKEIFHQTNRTVTTRYLSYVRQQIKKDSYHWYKAMRERQFEYIHEFKERIDEILWLQKKHHNIIDSTDNPSVQQISLAELHRLSITLSNYFDVAPDIINGSSISETPQSKHQQQTLSSNLSKLLNKPFWIWDKEEHLREATN
jgi:uncharacterized membrane protein YgaE (UPF0421/DUF939 family)